MLAALKVKLEHTEEYRVFRNIYDISVLRTKVKAAFNLETDDFDFIYSDSASDLIIVESLYDIDSIQQDSFYGSQSTSTMVKCMIRAKNKNSSLQEKTYSSPQSIITSTLSTNSNSTLQPKSPGHASSNFSGASGSNLKQKTAPPQQQQPKNASTASSSSSSSSSATATAAQLDQSTMLLDNYRRMENMLRETTENTNKITEMIAQQQQQQQESITAISSPTDAIRHCCYHWACDQCPDYHARTFCHHQNNIPYWCRCVPATSACEDKPFTMGELKKKKQDIQHSNVVCDHCNSGIVGIRYKCGHCPNFDLCEACESLAVHDQNHVFLKIRRPLSPLTMNLATNLLPSFDYSYKSTDCTTHQKPQANTEHETSTYSTTENNTKTAATPSSALAATFMDHTNVPDGHVVGYSECFLKLWRLKNTGSVPWPPGSVLKYIGGSVEPTKHQYQDDIKLPKVLTGEEVNVSIYVRAPGTSGKHIGCFRMVNPQGVQFGDPLWCDIKVSPRQSFETIPPTYTGSEWLETASNLSTYTSSTHGASDVSSSGSSSSVVSAPSFNNDEQVDDCGDKQDQTSLGYDSIPETINRFNPQSQRSNIYVINTRTPTVQHDHQVSPSSPSHADYVFINENSTDQPTLQPSSSSSSSSPYIGSATEKSPTNDTQTDMTDSYKVLEEQRNETKGFPYSQQLTKLHEMGFVKSDEEAKKLLIAHHGDLTMVWVKLWKSSLSNHGIQ